MTIDNDHRICEIEKEIAVLKAQKADADRVSRAFWAAVFALLLAATDLIIAIINHQ